MNTSCHGLFQIKVCGITRPEDAVMAADAGADAIGLNFYEASSRFVAPEAAALIAAEIRARVMIVGVFVNSTADEIQRIVSSVGLDAVQLHGDETPGLAAQIDPSVPLVRAYRCGADGLAPLRAWIEACEDAGRPIAAALIDAPGGKGEYGGTGRKADWDRVALEAPALDGTPLILAGGLRPENVAQAIRRVTPAGVDTASGVESAPGHKDPALTRGFVKAARVAFSEGQ